MLHYPKLKRTSKRPSSPPYGHAGAVVKGAGIRERSSVAKVDYSHERPIPSPVMPKSEIDLDNIKDWDAEHVREQLLAEIHHRIDEAMEKYEHGDKPEDFGYRPPDEKRLQEMTSEEMMQEKRTSEDRVALLLSQYRQICRDREVALDALQEWFDLVNETWHMKDDHGAFESDDEEESRMINLVEGYRQTGNRVRSRFDDIISYIQRALMRFEMHEDVAKALQSQLRQALEQVSKLGADLEDTVRKLRESEFRARTLQKTLDKRQAVEKAARQTEAELIEKLQQRVKEVTEQTQLKDEQLTKQLEDALATIEEQQRRIEELELARDASQVDAERAGAAAEVGEGEFGRPGLQKDFEDLQAEVELLRRQLDAAVKDKQDAETRSAEQAEALRAQLADLEKELQETRNLMQDELMTSGVGEPGSPEREKVDEVVRLLRSQHEAEKKDLQTYYQRQLERINSEQQRAEQRLSEQVAEVEEVRRKYHEALIDMNAYKKTLMSSASSDFELPAMPTRVETAGKITQTKLTVRALDERDFEIRQLRHKLQAMVQDLDNKFKGLSTIDAARVTADLKIQLDRMDRADEIAVSAAAAADSVLGVTSPKPSTETEPQSLTPASGSRTFDTQPMYMSDAYLKSMPTPKAATTPLGTPKISPKARPPVVTDDASTQTYGMAMELELKRRVADLEVELQAVRTIRKTLQIDDEDFKQTNVWSTTRRTGVTSNHLIDSIAEEARPTANRRLLTPQEGEMERLREQNKNLINTLVTMEEQAIAASQQYHKSQLELRGLLGTAHTREIEEERKMYRTQIDAMRISHARDEGALRKAVEDAQRAFVKELDDERRQHSEEVRKLKAGHQNDIHQLMSKLGMDAEARVAELQRVWDREREDYNKRLEHMREIVRDVEPSKRQWARDRAELLRHIALLEGSQKADMVSNLQSRIDAATNRITALEQDIIKLARERLTLLVAMSDDATRDAVLLHEKTRHFREQVCKVVPEEASASIAPMDISLRPTTLPDFDVVKDIIKEQVRSDLNIMGVASNTIRDITSIQDYRAEYSPGGGAPTLLHHLVDLSSVGDVVSRDLAAVLARLDDVKQNTALVPSNSAELQQMASHLLRRGKDLRSARAKVNLHTMGEKAKLKDLQDEMQRTDRNDKVTQALRRMEERRQHSVQRWATRREEILRERMLHMELVMHAFAYIATTAVPTTSRLQHRPGTLTDRGSTSPPTTPGLPSLPRPPPQNLPRLNRGVSAPVLPNTGPIDTLHQQWLRPFSDAGPRPMSASRDTLHKRPSTTPYSMLRATASTTDIHNSYSNHHGKDRRIEEEHVPGMLSLTKTWSDAPLPLPLPPFPPYPPYPRERERTSPTSSRLEVPRTLS